MSATYGYGDWQTAPHAWAALEAPDPPEYECPTCGELETMTDPGDFESGPTFACLRCEAEAERRVERHRQRGRFLQRRTVRRGESRAAEAYIRWGRRPRMTYARFESAVLGRLPSGSRLHWPFVHRFEDEAEGERTARLWRAHGREVRVERATACRLPASHPAVLPREHIADTVRRLAQAA